MMDNNMTVGFIGCGNMGGALASAACCSSLMLSDLSAEKVEEICKKTGGRASTAEDIAASADLVVLAVKPQGMAKVLASLSSVLAARRDRFVLLTMAAGISIAALREMAGGDYPVIRIMPNTPVSVGSGVILYTAEGVTDEELAAFRACFAKAGLLDAIPEQMMDAAAALSGCGPAFVYLFAEALSDGAVACGVPRDRAMLYAAATLEGAAKMLLQSGKHPGVLKDAVCSPGGTTIAGVKALEDSAFRAASMEAVIAAYERTLELKK
jgi:pyrroline-5-carboxylate reductase